MPKQTFEFLGASIDACVPVVVDYTKFKLDPSMNMMIGSAESSAVFAFMGGSPDKQIMRISKDGVWVDPDLATGEAAKAVIAALDTHLKHVFAKKDAAMRQALVAFQTTNLDQHVAAIKALEDALLKTVFTTGEPAPVGFYQVAIADIVRNGDKQ